MATIFAGASTMCVPTHDLSGMARWLRTCHPTYMTTTPAMLRSLVAEAEIREALRRGPPRCIHVTSAPLAADELPRLEALFGAPILTGYGMSEAPGIAIEAYPPVDRAPGSVGAPQCELRIIAADGRAVAPGERGEIVVRGPRVFAGYLDDPAATDEAFLPGGWFRTGDVGFLDEASNLHLTNRREEIVNRGGEKIILREVDEALLSHPAVAEAASFAVPDARLGEDIVAAVVLHPVASLRTWELRCWLLERLRAHKVPRRIWIVAELPRTPTGKIWRSELARRWAQERQ
jgi:acyl-CoA synthetase (AMP-forming)/AMP-acid ligase II